MKYLLSANPASPPTVEIEIIDDGTEFILWDGVRVAKRGHPGTPTAHTWTPLVDDPLMVRRLKIAAEIAAAIAERENTEFPHQRDLSSGQFPVNDPKRSNREGIASCIRTIRRKNRPIS
jgi:hypothetical protein